VYRDGEIMTRLGWRLEASLRLCSEIMLSSRRAKSGEKMLFLPTSVQSSHVLGFSCLGGKRGVSRLEEDVDGLNGIAVCWETLNYW
jgi:hypothetical protein